MNILTIISAVLLLGFIIYGVEVFGLLPSYSAYASKWTDRVHLGGLHLWSIVTIVSALLMVPPMIEAGEENALQFLGFFAPLYLIAVGLTPEWESRPKQHRVHTICAIVCALCAIVWVVVVCHLWYILVALAVLVVEIAVCMGRKDAYVFWGEMVMFISAYVTLLAM